MTSGDKFKVDDNKPTREFTLRKRKIEREDRAPPKRRNNKFCQDIKSKVNNIENGNAKDERDL